MHHHFCFYNLIFSLRTTSVELDGTVFKSGNIFITGIDESRLRTPVFQKIMKFLLKTLLLPLAYNPKKLCSFHHTCMHSWVVKNTENLLKA